MDEEQQSRLLHRLKYRVEFFRVGDALGGVGGRAFRIPFDSDDARRFRRQHGFRGEAVAEIEAHQRGEGFVRRDVGENALAVGGDGVDAVHRRGEVGHDERACALGGGIGHGAGQGGAVAQVDVQVVRGGEGEGLHGGSCFWGWLCLDIRLI